MPTVLFEATYFILDNDYVTSYLLQLIGDMKDVLIRLDSGHDHIRIEIYKHQRFKYWFHLYINEVVTAPMRRLFLICHFPLAEFLVSLFRPIQRELYQFFIGFKCVTLKFQLVLCLIIRIVYFMNVLGNFFF